MYFNSNLSYLRIKRQLTQTALGNEIDSSKQIICNYETGLREPSLSSLVKISRYFGVTIDEILMEDLQPTGSIISRNLKYLRKRERYTQGEMANLLRVSKSNMSKYESGIIELNNQGLVNVSEFFGVSVDDLLKKDLSKGGYDE